MSAARLACDEPPGQLGREAHAGLGRARRQPQRPYHPTNAEGGVDVAQPVLVLLVLAVGQAVLQPGRHVSRRLVARHRRIVGGDDDRAQIAQVELVEVVEGAFGPVQPLGHAQPGEQLLGQRHDAGGRHLGLALGAELRVLLLEGLAHRGHAAPQHLLGHRLLLGRQVGQHGVAMAAHRPQSLGLGPHRQLGHRRAGRTLGARRPLPGLAPGPLATGVGPGTTSGPVGAVAAVAGPAAVTVGTALAVTAGPAVVAVALAPGPLALGHQGLRHRFERRRGGQQLDALGFLAGALGRQHRDDGDAVDVEVGLGPQHVADLGARREQAAVDHTTRFAGAGRPPRPVPVGARARQLEFDPPGHGWQRYPRPPRRPPPLPARRPVLATVVAVPIYALGDVAPRIDPTAFVHPDAVVIGDVTIGPSSSVWPSAVLRGDGQPIRIGARTSVQDGAVVHCTEDYATVVGDECTIGHLVHLEGCTIESGCLIGVGAIVLHEVVVATGSIVAANAVLLDGTKVPSRCAGLRRAGQDPGGRGPPRADRGRHPQLRGADEALPGRAAPDRLS